jgi:branched-chain amino acid transport system permease protein
MLLGALGLLVAIAMPLVLGSYGISLLTQMLIFALLAMSLDILVGYAGLVSLNHASFFGIAAYTVGILSTHGYNNFWLGLAAGVVAALLLGLVLGLLVLRSSGPYFLMITLAFGQMLFALAWKWRFLTGGDDGLPGIARPDLGIPVSLWPTSNFYYLVLAVWTLSLVFLYWFIRSPRGKSIVGTRESESRMQALGYNTWAIKYLAYVLAGGVAGLAGVLHVYYNGFVSPQELNWTMSGTILLMVIIGGAGTLFGPALGAGIIVLLQNLVSSYTERWPLAMGIVFILCVMYSRSGLWGYILELRNKGRMDHECLRSKKPQ